MSWVIWVILFPPSVLRFCGGRSSSALRQAGPPGAQGGPLPGCCWRRKTELVRRLLLGPSNRQGRLTALSSCNRGNRRASDCPRASCP